MSEFADGQDNTDPFYTLDADGVPDSGEPDLTIYPGNGMPSAPEPHQEELILPAETRRPSIQDPELVIIDINKDPGAYTTPVFSEEELKLHTELAGTAAPKPVIPESVLESPGLSEDLRRQIEEPLKPYVGEIHDGEEIYQGIEANYQRRVAAGEPISDREHDLMRSVRLTRLAISNFGPSVPFEQKSVNDVIAGYEATKHDPYPLATPTDRLMPGILSYMRDEHGAETMGDVAATIRRGDVPRGIVELWVEEGAVGTTSIDAAIVGAYPDLADKLQEAKDRNADSLKDQTNRLFGNE